MKYRGKYRLKAATKSQRLNTNPERDTSVWGSLKLGAFSKRRKRLSNSALGKGRALSRGERQKIKAEDLFRRVRGDLPERMQKQINGRSGDMKGGKAEGGARESSNQKR